LTGIVGKLGVKFLFAPEFALAIGGAAAQTARVELLATAATVDQEPDVADSEFTRGRRGIEGDQILPTEFR
jgi:hypothetical protein